MTIPVPPMPAPLPVTASAARPVTGRRRTAALGAVALVAVAAAACGTAAGASPATARPSCGSGHPRITVEASGQASATPDLLTIDIGVAVTDPTATAALADANARAGTLTTSLQSSGVTPADIQSTDFTIDPTTAPDGTITGYQVSNTLIVTLHDLVHAGQAIDTAAASVGNAIRINGLSFSVSNTGNVDGEARADAVQTAAAHARAMTSAAHEALGAICSINDTTSSPSGYFGAGEPQASDGAAAVPLEAGTQQSTAEVTVVYAIGSD
jgi:uncharacterized protein YggE